MKKEMPLPLAIAILVIALVVTLWGRYDAIKKGRLIIVDGDITSFAECKAAGFPIMESYPEQCIAPLGKHFINPDQIMQGYAE